MARSPDPLEDPTPLDSSTIDVRRRVGWLLRTARLHGAAGPTTAHAFSAALGVPPAAVSKWEKGSVDPGPAALGGYARVLGLQPGLLLALAAGLRREFDQPSRRPTAPAYDDLGRAGEQVRAALTGPATGADWMAFAATLTSGPRQVVPDFVTRPAIDRLVSETVRSVDAAYLTRMEALSLLLTGPHHLSVSEACLDFALEPSTQVAADVLGVLGARPDRALLDTMCRLLRHPDDSVFLGACHAVVAMRRTRPRLPATDLREVAPAVLDAYAACADDPERHDALSAVLRELPQGFRKLVTARGLPDLAAPPLGGPDSSPDGGPDSDPDDGHEERWSLACSIGVEVMHRLDARPEPLLTRTTYEALTGAVSLRCAWARLVLMALPYRDVVGQVVAEECERADGSRLRALAPLLSYLGRPGVPQAERWVAGPVAELQRGGLRALAHHGDEVDTARTRALLGSEHASVRRLAAYAAGMVGAPVLKEWAVDPDLSEASRVAADWWLRQGPRVDDAEPSGGSQPG